MRRSTRQQSAGRMASRLRPSAFRLRRNKRGLFHHQRRHRPHRSARRRQRRRLGFRGARDDGDRTRQTYRHRLRQRASRVHPFARRKSGRRGRCSPEASGRVGGRARKRDPETTHFVLQGKWADRRALCLQKSRAYRDPPPPPDHRAVCSSGQSRGPRLTLLGGDGQIGRADETRPRPLVVGSSPTVAGGIRSIVEKIDRGEVISWRIPRGSKLAASSTATASNRRAQHRLTLPVSPATPGESQRASGRAGCFQGQGALSRTGRSPLRLFLAIRRVQSPVAACKR